MDNVALCKCGVDMCDHYHDDFDDNDFDHPFTASGTKYRCEVQLTNGYLCAMPRGHTEYGAPHGPIRGHL